jgi:hypothetical protein
MYPATWTPCLKIRKEENMKKRIIYIFLSLAMVLCAGAFIYAHDHKPPHNGTLVECGEEFAHLELLADPGSGKITGYVLDGEAENPVRLEQKIIRLKLKANGVSFLLDLKAVENPLTGEVNGNTSEFSGFSRKLKGAARFSGSISMINVRGVVFRSVDFKYPEGNEAPDISTVRKEKEK